MTSGPEARLGGVADISFPWPRDRNEVIARPACDDLRERIIGFLDEHSEATCLA